MAIGRGRGKVNVADKKDEKTLAGTKSSSTESAMDEYLKKMDMFRKPVAKDGSCLFRVVSEQVYHTQSKHLQVRFECIDYMKKHRHLFESFVEGSYDHHVYSLRNSKEWGGQVEISALSHLYKHDFVVYQTANTSPQYVTCNGFSKKISLCYLNGNHYDSVYPISYKSNAAMVQSLLYDVLLDQVFPEIEFNEKERDSSYTPDQNNTVGWTEVKNKQSRGCQGKTHDESADRIVHAFPDAGKNQKVYWQLKRSLDPTFYRNIELEVWEDQKTAQQKFDRGVAAGIHFKPGDLCLATIKESKDVSETIRVKIQEINPDKCRVCSEDFRTQYYVQLNDLKPLLNGDHHTDSYRDLPGYYNKSDNDIEFQAQKRRGKNRRYRDEEQRKHDTTNSPRLNESRRHDSRTDKDARNNRRTTRKDVEKKKDIDKELKQPIKGKLDSKKVDKAPVDGEETSTTSSNEPVKVAKPAESSAAFWGRMRTMKDTTTGYSKPMTTCGNQTATSDVTTDSFPSNLNDAHPSANDSKPLPKKINENKSSRVSQHNISQTEKLSVSSKPASVNKEGISETTVTSSKPVWGNMLSPTSSSDEVMLDTVGLITTSVSHEGTATVNDTIEASFQDTRKFNLTTQASIKVNEVRESILATSAKMFGDVPNDKLLTTNPPIDLKQINSELKSRSPNLSVSPLIPINLEHMSSETNTMEEDKNTDTLLREEEEFETKNTRGNYTYVNENLTELDKGKLNTYNTNKKSFDSIDSANVCGSDQKKKTMVESDALRSPINDDAKEIENTVVSGLQRKDIVPKTIPDLDRHSTKPTEQFLLEEKEKSSKVKKKVSFGLTTEIQEKTGQVFSNVHVDTSGLQPVMSHSEPGKIVLPPDHREKHMTQFPGAPLREVEQQPQPYFQHPFIHAGLTYYPSLSSYQSTPHVLPMFNTTMNDHPHLPNFSRDPDGKDLPEDVTTLRHFYNLGVQFHAMTLQNNLHLNQPGLLPLPTQQHHVSSLPLRSLVMTSEASNMHATDVYFPNNAQLNEPPALLDNTGHTNAMLAGRFQATHPLSIPVPTQSFEEYECPPRLRRNPPVNRGNPRYLQHRPLVNGRGIMGQAPRQRNDFVRYNYQN